MQNQGYSRNNLHRGDVRITGDLEVDGTLEIDSLNVNSLTIGDPEYTLPTAKGNAGDIIVATTDGSTSEWQQAFQGTGRVWQNQYSMYEPRAFSSKSQFLAIDEFGYGSRFNIDTANFPVGSSFRFTLKSQCAYQCFNSGDDIIMQLRLEIIGTGFVGIFLDLWQYNIALNCPQTVGIIQTGVIDTTFYLTRTATNTIRINSLSVNNINNQNVPNNATPVTQSVQNLSLGTFPLDFPFADCKDLALTLSSKDTSISASSITAAKLQPLEYTIDLCSNSTSILATSANLTTDHTLLSNLNLGDAGHTQFALLSGRSGGQILSGGITPLHDLKLKSHSAGLDNIIVKDLKTEFKKEIDMDSNNIVNASQIVGASSQGTLSLDSSPSVGVELVSSGSKSININSNNDINATATAFLNTDAAVTYIKALGVPVVQVDSSEVSVSQNLNMNGLNINNAKDILSSIGSNKIDMSTGGFLNTLELTSTDEIKLQETTNNNFINVSNAGMNLNTLVGTQSISHVGANNTINMNNTSLLGAISLLANSGGVYLQEGTSTNNLVVANAGFNQNTNLGVTTIRNSDPLGNIEIIKLGGGLIELKTQAGTEVTIDNNVVKVNGTDDITIPISIGVPSGSFQVVQGGAYINKSLQVDGDIYCSNINNIKPSGGVYSESTGFTILAANTTETNLLGQGSSSGSLTVPANGFTALDVYAFKASGRLSGGQNDLFTLRLKSEVNGGLDPTITIGSLSITLQDNGLVDVWWDITADFTIRAVGAATVAYLVLGGVFRYTNTNDVVRIYGRTILENTNFDTTKSNTLQLTYQNDATNPATSFSIDQSSFTKWF